MVQVLQEHRVQLVLPELKVLQVQVVLKVFKDQKVLKEVLVFLALMDLQEHQVL